MLDDARPPPPEPHRGGKGWGRQRATRKDLAPLVEIFFSANFSVFITPLLYITFPLYFLDKGSKVLSCEGFGMHVGEMVKEVRMRRGLTQAEFAELLGISQPRVSQMEERRSGTVGMLERVAEGVGMELRVQFVELHPLGRR